MIRGSAAMLFTGGIMLWVMSEIIPFLNVILMDWVAVFMMFGGIFILLFVFPISGVSLQYDTIPPGSAIINYIRRDGIIAPLLGRRIFSGESFLDVPRLGLIEDLGKDTVFLWGRKKVRFGIENINYTPDPRYWNLCNELYRLGFDDTDDLFNVLNIPSLNYETDKAKKVYYLERMAQIYWNMTHQQSRRGERLVKSFKSREDKNVAFGKRRRVVPDEKTTKAKEARVETKEETRKEISSESEEEHIKKVLGED